MKSSTEGTLIGLFYKALALLMTALGVILLGLAFAGDGPEAMSKLYGGLWSLGSALGLGWMGAVVDLLHKIASVREERPATASATPARQSSTAPKARPETPATYKLD